MTTSISSVSKTDLESIYLIWLDASVNITNENIDAQKHFQSLIPRFNSFENITTCEQFIQQRVKDDRIFFIVSGRLGQEIVSHIHQYRQIVSIYIYCQDIQKNEEWSSKWFKIKIVTNKLEILIKQIQLDYSKRIQHKVDESFPINISNELFHSQLIINCLLQMKTNTTDKIELINICLNEYINNNNELTIVHEFEKDYVSNQVLWWYTRDSFINRLLNKALSSKNLDLLFLFGFFIRDMKEILDRNKCKYSVEVYHGQIMSIDELLLLKNSIGNYILINKFILGNYQPKTIISYLNEFITTKDLTRVLFEIDAEPQIDHSKPYANITPFTYLPQEQQILFMLGSIFQIINVQHDKMNNLWIIKIILSNIKKDYDETNLISCGYIFQDIGQFQHAEKYFKRLLKEISPTHEDYFKCYDALGSLTFLRNNYELSLQWYKKLIQILKSDHPYLPYSYYSIGCIYQKLSKFHQALEYYNKAIDIWQNLDSDNEPIEMAECFNNMGCIYEIQKVYSTALEHHQKSLSIRNKYQIDIGSSYNNIANIYLSLGEYDNALENYRNSLTIKKKSLSADDPSLATTLENVALVYEENENYEESLKYYKTVAMIYEKIYPLTHTSNIEIQKHIQRISSLITNSHLQTLV